jgi:hypothetical protein
MSARISASPARSGGRALDQLAVEQHVDGLVDTSGDLIVQYLVPGRRWR